MLTEAATGSYAVTAAIAALGGAGRVYAVSRDSEYGSAADAEHQTLRMARACGTKEPVHVIGDLDEAVVRDSDVITNLGFVRPIDARAAAWMKTTAVVALMCESWELRPRDVDIDACRAHEILLLATNEHDVSFPLFRYCGPLAVRMLSDAGFEVPGTRVAVMSGVSDWRMRNVAIASA